jgi:two-component system response regulator AtoC
MDVAHSFRIDPTDLPSESVIFGSTSAMREIQYKIERTLNSDLPVLIRGESGTGKELIAKYLHSRSRRSEAPFVKLNCAAIPIGLLESELLGYEKGAFTGASDTKRGLVEIASSGTLFLDEIGDMDWGLQTKLLHLLQDGHYARIGAREERQANARIICATNCDLYAAVAKHTFREDLFYRIDVIGLHLQPLRERREDIPQLAEYCMQKLARRYGRKPEQLTPTVLHLLKQWDWPGNMRELENWIVCVLILGSEQALSEELKRRVALSMHADNQQPHTCHLKEASRQATSMAARALILKVLQDNHWNRRKTAADLNMSYRSLLYKLREAGVPQRRNSSSNGSSTTNLGKNNGFNREEEEYDK